MSDEIKKSPEKSDKFRLVVMNDETFEEVGSYKLTLFNIYALISTILVIVVIFVVSLIVFTPLKRLVPGYGNVNAHSKAIKNSKEVDALEKEIAARDHYIETLQRLIDGNFETADQNEANLPVLKDSIREIAPITEDSIIREMVAREEWLSLPEPTQNENTSKIALEELYFIPPVKGYVTDEFMPEKAHFGTDIAASKNSAIKSTLEGRVLVSDWTLETGYVIGIQHSNNLISFYKHNSVLLKKVGSFVKAGEAIAIIGDTGDLSDGPHLHFELWHNGNPVDPAEYINF